MTSFPTISRRQALLTSGALLVGVLAGCAAGAITPAQILADAQGIVTKLYLPGPPPSGVLASLGPLFPTILSSAVLGNIETGIVAAETLLAGLASGAPAATGASVLQTVEGYVNDAIDVLATIPVIPPPYNLVIVAVSVLLPGIEAFVNSIIPASTTKAAARYRALATPMTAAQARALLGIPAA